MFGIAVYDQHCEVPAAYKLLLYLERIGELKNFPLLKEIYNRIKVITTLNGKLAEKYRPPNGKGLG